MDFSSTLTLFLRGYSISHAAGDVKVGNFDKWVHLQYNIKQPNNTRLKPNNYNAVWGILVAPVTIKATLKYTKTKGHLKILVTTLKTIRLCSMKCWHGDDLSIKRKRSQACDSLITACIVKLEPHGLKDSGHINSRNHLVSSWCGRYFWPQIKLLATHLSWPACLLVRVFKWGGFEDLFNVFYGVDTHGTHAPAERHRGQWVNTETRDVCSHGGPVSKDFCPAGQKAWKQLTTSDGLSETRPKWHEKRNTKQDVLGQGNSAWPSVSETAPAQGFHCVWTAVYAQMQIKNLGPWPHLSFYFSVNNHFYFHLGVSVYGSFQLADRACDAALCVKSQQQHVLKLYA